MKKSEFAYLAGLVDGEGSICLVRSSKTAKFRWPCLSISNTTPNIIDWCKQTFGGSVVHKPKKQVHHSDAYEWRLRNKPMLFHVLANICPYMLVPEKVRRINLLLSEYDSCTPRNGKYTPNQLTQKQDFENRFFHPSEP